MTLKFSDYVWPSTRMTKKWMVRVNGKLVHFGSAGSGDYTIHHDKERRRRYIMRHMKDRIDDEETPGFWSMWLLWQETDINKAFDNIIANFNPNIEPMHD